MHASHHIDQSGNSNCRACVFVHIRISAMLASAMLALCVWTYTASLLYAFMHQLPHRRILVVVAQWRYWNGEYLCQPCAEQHSQIEDSAGTGHGGPGLNAETLEKSAKAMQPKSVPPLSRVAM